MLRLEFLFFFSSALKHPLWSNTILESKKKETLKINAAGSPLWSNPDSGLHRTLSVRRSRNRGSRSLYSLVSFIPLHNILLTSIARSVECLY